MGFTGSFMNERILMKMLLNQDKVSNFCVLFPIRDGIVYGSHIM